MMMMCQISLLICHSTRVPLLTDEAPIDSLTEVEKTSLKACLIAQQLLVAL